MVLQALLNGLVEASVIVLAAVGLSLLYGVKKFANFAHGDMMTVGAYFALYVMGTTRGGLIVGILSAMIFLAFLGILFEFFIFARLDGRGPVAPLVASVGLALVLQNGLRSVFGTSLMTYGIQLPESWIFGIRDPFTGYGLRMNPIQDLLPMVLAFALVLFVALLLRYTKLGKAMRATSDNPDLARVSGINVAAVRYATWALSGALAGAGGFVLAIKLPSFDPLLGSSVLLLVFCAVILGGIGSAYGAMLGALVIGVTRNLFFPFATSAGIPTEFSLIVPFGIMVLVLLVRPQGLAGRPIGFDLPPLRAELRKLWRTFVRFLARGFSRIGGRSA